MDYGFEHAGKVYTPNGTAGITPAENADRNKAIEAAELDAWKAQPDRMLAYFSFPAEEDTGRAFGKPKLYRADFYPPLRDAAVKTWLGTKLGTITAAHVFTSGWYGYRQIAITVKATNGATYHGRASWDWGQCVTLRRGKR